MKYLQIHIKTESGDDIGKFLTKIAGALAAEEIEYELVYKDSVVEDMVRGFIADHLSDQKYLVEDDNKL